MQKFTYIQENLRNNKIIRWPDNCFPLKFYIAPFRWYKAPNEAYKYKQIVMDALNTWQEISQGKITFDIVNALTESQINLEWKRVDRKSLGYCHFNFDTMHRLYSAEVQIGMSDGIIHQQYMDENEVFHTVLHEIGHSLGLGHSPDKNDIMYTPHQYGNVRITQRDIDTLNWLYKLPTGATPQEIGTKYSLHLDDIDDIIAYISENKPASEFEKVKNGIKMPEKDLLDEQTRIAELKKYNLLLQNIIIPQNITYPTKKPPQK